MNHDTMLAAEIAHTTGAALRALQRSAAPERIGTAELKDDGDHLGQATIARMLQESRPDDVVLSEEAVGGSDRLTAARVWIVDPLDGTREFSEGRDDWAVHVALWERGSLTAGAVALPGLEVTLDSRIQPITWNEPTRIRLATSRSRSTALVSSLRERLGAELVPMGSAGFKAGAVIRGDVDAYVHSGGQYEWDSAAPVAVARAAGLFTSRVDGAPLEYNRPDPFLPDLVICNPTIATTVLAQLSEILDKEADDV